ncbi:protein FAM151B [Chelonus insularis]|uniref:protein FAM151B n=1 Tax=Chelonus insularis TaxID=460826 RepID=UPI00158C8408|nr:protein FAM151B [Chelonus insularis]
MGLSTFVICISFLLYIPQTIMATVSPDTKEFFKDTIKGNLTKVTWAHAVNSKEFLNQTLRDASIMMVEADVVLGHVNSNPNETVPIMAHPPKDSSDLTLEEFLMSTIQDGKKGIKLDFKTIEAFNSSIPILEKYRMNLTFPVWLNADILRGPVNATTAPVNAQEFLSKASKNFSESTLSIGWTTKYGQSVNISEGNYTKEQIEEMMNTVVNVTQTITYPVRAGLIINTDIHLWENLLKNTSAQKSTLTIWSNGNDSVDAKKLSTFIKTIGVDKVYVDVPSDLFQKLDISAANAKTSGFLMMTCAVLMNILLTKLF